MIKYKLGYSIYLFEIIILVKSGKWRIWASFPWSHDSVGRIVESGVALNSLSEVLIITNISGNFVLVFVLMTTQTVVDCFDKLSICFMEIFDRVRAHTEQRTFILKMLMSTQYFPLLY